MKGKEEISKLKKLGLVSAATLMGLIVVVSQWGNSLDLFHYDYLFLLRGNLPKPENIVVVGIDEDSFRELGSKWTLGTRWPRSIHAQLIRKLKEAGAAVIAFDLLFAEPSTTEQDESLASAIEDAKNVVLVSQVDIQSDNSGASAKRCMVVEPSPIRDLISSKNFKVGFSDVQPDFDGFVRGLYVDTAKFPDSSCLDKSHQKAFSVVAAEEYLKRIVGPKKASIDYRKISADGFAAINFIGGRNYITTVSYYQALEPEEHVRDGLFRDALVFVGYTVGSEALEKGTQTDQFPIPFSRGKAPYMSGVEIHAQAAHGFIQNNLIRRISPQFSILVGIVCAILLGFTFLTWRLLYGSIVFIMVEAGVFALSYYLFVTKAIYLSPFPLTIPLFFAFLTSPFVYYWTTYKQKSFIRHAFATYLSPKLVDRLIDHPDSLRLGGDDIEATVAFIDIAGFTTISENLTPQQLISLMNNTLGDFTDIIMKHDGMVDKYIGDCVMALWGVPMFDSYHGLQACKAILDIRDALKNLQEKNKTTYGVEISIRVGLSSGKMVAGNVGGGLRFNYTVLGNEVNLASRLESLNKVYGTEILLSDGTAALVRDQLVLREIDIVSVKGQERKTPIFTILGDGTGIVPLDYRLNELYQHGRKFYATREWAAAREAFLAALELNLNDGPSKEFLRRVEEYSKNPPASDWDGVYKATQK